MALNQNELITLLAKSLCYTPIIYKQSTYLGDQANFGNEYVLEFKQTDLPDDSILLFVPSFSSVSGKDCKLTIRVPFPNEEGGYNYQDHVFDVVVEQNDDTPRGVTQGDIIANRMCIFRFRKKQNTAILCNSPLYNDAIFSKVQITDGVFLNRPIFVDPENPTITYTLVTTKELAELEKRITSLEKKFRFGTLSPEEALASAEAGTIYIQIEED